MQIILVIKIAKFTLQRINLTHFDYFDLLRLIPEFARAHTHTQKINKLIKVK